MKISLRRRLTTFQLGSRSVRISVLLDQQSSQPSSYPSASFRVFRAEGKGRVGSSRGGRLLQLLEEFRSRTLRGTVLEVEVWFSVNVSQPGRNHICGESGDVGTYILQRSPPWVPCDQGPLKQP